ncbi:MAG: hypothetical protein K9J17_01570 [Flavobacteriales bacterium]|nr:hypothetical protein [Flavobacteriales bacterium]
MKNPSPLIRYSFIAAIGFLFVGALFTMVKWPAAELFAILGGASTVALYVLFNRAAAVKRTSAYPRHAAFLALVTAIVLKSFGLSIGSYFMFIALVAVLVWFVWSVLEELPPSED